jgi:hypothetical protein
MKINPFKNMYQTTRSRCSVRERAGGYEHEVVGVCVAVKAAGADVAGGVLIRAPVDTGIVHEKEDYKTGMLIAVSVGSWAYMPRMQAPTSAPRRENRYESRLRPAGRRLVASESSVQQRDHSDAQLVGISRKLGEQP